MEPLNQESIANACRAMGLNPPPSERFKVQQIKRGSQSKVAPMFRRKRSVNPPIDCASIVAEIPTHSGIYFFWRKGACFYVGKADNLWQRLKGHWTKKYCDEVAWLPYPRAGLLNVEAFYIGVLCPLANHGTIERVRVDEGETYWHEERIGDLVLSRTLTYLRPTEIPLPPGAVIKFPGRPEAS